MPQPIKPSIKWALDQRVVIEGRWFVGTPIRMDGYRWVRCRFDGCQISYFSSDFEITECYFDKCTILHPMHGVMLVRLFHLNYPEFDQCWAEFAPVRHPDGTVTVDTASRDV